MVMVKVWNKGDFTHQEPFREELIVIKPGEYIEMDHEQATLFKGQYYPPAKDPDGNLIPIKLDETGNPIIGAGGYKYITVDHPPVENQISDADITKMSLKCQSCGFDARSKWELEGHIAALHVAQMKDIDAKEELIKKTRGK